MISLLLTLAAPVYAPTWQPITLSWYQMGKTTADGSKMRPDGAWLATYREKMGAVLEVRVGKITQTLVVRDRPSKKFGHRGDLPRDTWLVFGKPLSKGLIKGEYRRVK